MTLPWWSCFKLGIPECQYPCAPVVVVGEVDCLTCIRSEHNCVCVLRLVPSCNRRMAGFCMSRVAGADDDGIGQSVAVLGRQACAIPHPMCLTPLSHVACGIGHLVLCLWETSVYVSLSCQCSQA